MNDSLENEWGLVIGYINLSVKHEHDGACRLVYVFELEVSVSQDLTRSPFLYRIQGARTESRFTSQKIYPPRGKEVKPR